MNIAVRYYTRSGNTEKLAKAIAEAVGMLLSEEEFHCRGSFGPVHKSHPDKNDLTKAAAFAKMIVK